MRAERVPEYGVDIWVPIPDFQVPSERQLAQVENALERAFAAALDGKRVYVGCAGGYGRTGLFLALMAKVAGVKDPVAYVRLHYNSHAGRDPRPAALRQLVRRQPIAALVVLADVDTPVVVAHVLVALTSSNRRAVNGTS